MGIRVVVVGGSLGGLSSALALRCINCNVDVFERSRGAMKSRGAGFVLQTELVDFLKEHSVVVEEAISVPAYKRQYILQDGSIQWEEHTLQRMTSWDTLYRQLRNALPDDLYHKGKRLTSFEQNKNYVVAEFEDGHSERCDLLVGADGPSSTVRQQLLPDVFPKYSGYVAWRGVVDENKVPIDVVQFFANKFTFFHRRNTQILCYLIPGHTGELSEGERRLNWVWYYNISAGNKLQSLLTDRYGKQREFSVPQGMVRDYFVQQQKSIAERILPTVFGQLVVQTNEPFILTIYDLSVPRMAFGRICILGDAAFVPRPHTAAGVSKVATNAVTLANSIANSSNVDVVEALKRWEPHQIELGNTLKYLGISLGNRSQFDQT
jgi:2,6-dihydroxypyridine 3-monooxygenase